MRPQEKYSEPGKDFFKAALYALSWQSESSRCKLRIQVVGRIYVELTEAGQYRLPKPGGFLCGPKTRPAYAGGTDLSSYRNLIFFVRALSNLKSKRVREILFCQGS